MQPADDAPDLTADLPSAAEGVEGVEGVERPFRGDAYGIFAVTLVVAVGALFLVRGAAIEACLPLALGAHLISLCIAFFLVLLTLLAGVFVARMESAALAHILLAVGVVACVFAFLHLTAPSPPVDVGYEIWVCRDNLPDWWPGFLPRHSPLGKL